MGKFNIGVHPHNPLSTDHYDRIKTTGNKGCFVCDKPFKKKQRAIYSGLIPRGPHEGEKMYSHANCNCFSSHYYKKFHGCTSLLNNGGSYLVIKKRKDEQKARKEKEKKQQEKPIKLLRWNRPQQKGG